ncbi:MAG: HAD-IA family hydrolase [Saprospiraceae bacterium]|nr:HAD-IA family hydrolase [Saprospiraceae bacterium]
MEKALIIWDCDGVLVDSEWLGAKAFSEILHELGADLTIDYIYHSLKGGDIHRSLAFVHQHVQIPKGYDVEMVYRTRADELFDKELKQIEGSDEVLNHSKTKRCVASNGPKDKIIRNLHITDLKKYFDDAHIFSAHDINVFKPNPDLFLYAASVMGVKTESCIVIEDSVHGAEAAKRAGMTCYGYCASTDRNDMMAQGAIPINHMNELLHLIP